MADAPQRGRIPFAISHRDLDARTSVVSVQGDCDLATAPSLKWELIDLLADGRSRLIVDLSRVTFMDSTALGALVGIQITMDPDEMLVLAGAQPSVLKLFELTGLNRRLTLFSTVDAALARVREASSDGAEDSDPAHLAPDDSSHVEDPPGPAPAAITLDDPRAEAASEPTQLTRDAALALGIAATAVPFARSRRAQAERWLRALHRCGSAGIALSSLGVTDIPPAQSPEHEAGDGPESESPTDRDAVATVTDHARRLAGRRGSSPISTTDLLGAVVEVYRSELDRLLIGYGTHAGEISELLARDEAEPRER